MIGKAQTKEFLKAARQSDIVLALVAVILIDLICRFAWHCNQPQSFTLRFDEPYRSRIWWAMKDFISEPKTADVVLMGASDMTCAFYGAEATYLNTPIRQILKHRSQYLEDQLENLASPFGSTFCLGIPGEMPSDAYFLAATILGLKKRPKAICLSITPRDLYDATFGDPTSTDIYKVACKLGLGSAASQTHSSSFWDQLDHQLQRSSSVYGHKWELTSWQHQVTHGVLCQITGEKFATIATPQPIRKLALLQLPEDYGPNEVIEYPFDPQHPIWTNNIAEYQSRYRQFKISTFNQQLAFLKSLAQLCRSEGVGLLVINSPLTSENRVMIEKRAYELYMSEVPKTVRSGGGIFVDLDSLTTFKHDDFFDSIHLNGKGGEKFLDQIALVLSKSSQLAGANAHLISSQHPY